MRVAVFGYQSWGRRALSAVISAGHQAVLVVAHPACDHLYQQMWADSVEELASEHVLQVCDTERVGQDVIDGLRDAGPELLRIPSSARPRAFRACLAGPLRRKPPAEPPSLTREELRWSVGRPVPTCRRRRLFWILFASTTTRNCPRPNSLDIGLDISNQRFDLSLLCTGYA